MTDQDVTASLIGSLVRLEPIGVHHAGDLADAAQDRSAFGWAAVPEPSSVEAYTRNCLDWCNSGERVPFAQVRRSGERAVGCTMFANLRRRGPGEEPYAVEVGGTWLGRVGRRTTVGEPVRR